MYNKIECITVSCDNCGEGYQDDHSGFSIFADEVQAHHYLDNDDWYEQDGKHYCPNCHAIDEDDNLVLNAKPATR